MAIARDATSGTLDGTGTATSISVSHTCTGANRILIASLAIGGNQTATATYGASSMVSIGRDFSNRSVQLFYLLNPATGANTLAASWATGALAYIEGMSYTGAQQSGQPDSFGTGTYSGPVTTLTASTSVVASNCWLVGALYSTDGNGVTYTAGTQTSINAPQQQNVNATSLGIDSNGTVGTGSQALTITQSVSNSGGWGMVVASIVPAGGAVATAVTHNLNLLGIGS